MFIRCTRYAHVTSVWGFIWYAYCRKYKIYFYKVQRNR